MKTTPTRTSKEWTEIRKITDVVTTYKVPAGIAAELAPMTFAQVKAFAVPTGSYVQTYEARREAVISGSAYANNIRSAS